MSEEGLRTVVADQLSVLLDTIEDGQADLIDRLQAQRADEWRTLGKKLSAKLGALEAGVQASRVSQQPRECFVA